MTEPFLVEESTPTQLSPKLEDLAKKLGKDAVHHDYLMALVIVVMSEAGFAVMSSGCTETDQRYEKRQLNIPADWKSSETGTYTVKFYLRSLPNQECRILAIPSGDTLVINFIMPRDFGNMFSMAVQTVKYVNVYSSDLAGRYLNLKEFSIRFKDTISTRARCEILSAACVANGSLSGLPVEINIKILGMLDVYSLTRIAQTSKQFRQLTGESRIWKNLSRRDFRRMYLDETIDYRKSYQEHYVGLKSARYMARLIKPVFHPYQLPPPWNNLRQLDEFSTLHML